MRYLTIAAAFLLVGFLIAEDVSAQRRGGGGRSAGARSAGAARSMGGGGGYGSSSGSYNFEAEFTLGLLYGFASYHGCLIDLPLPTSLFKILMKLDSLPSTGTGTSTGSDDSCGGAAYGVDQKPNLDDILQIRYVRVCTALSSNSYVS